MELINPIDFIPYLDFEILFYDNRGVMGSIDKKEVAIRTNNNMTMKYPLPCNFNNNDKVKFFSND